MLDKKIGQAIRFYVKSLSN